MAKTKKTTSKKAKEPESKRGPRKGTRIAFLRDLYGKTPNISNEKALEKLLASFPESNADVKSIITWKKMLRDEGMDIPLQRSGAKAGSGKKEASGKKTSKKKVVKKKASKD